MPRTRRQRHAANRGVCRSKTTTTLGPPSHLAGVIMWLPPSNQLIFTGDHDLGLDDGCYDHPVVILSPSMTKGTVTLLIITSFRGVDLATKHPGQRNLSLRAHYLPIHPAEPHPDVQGKLLYLQHNGELPKKSYINTETQHSVPLDTLRTYYRPGTGSGVESTQAPGYLVLTAESYQVLAQHAGYVVPVPSPAACRNEIGLSLSGSSRAARTLKNTPTTPTAVTTAWPTLSPTTSTSIINPTDEDKETEGLLRLASARGAARYGATTINPKRTPATTRATGTPRTTTTTGQNQALHPHDQNHHNLPLDRHPQRHQPSQQRSKGLNDNWQLRFDESSTHYSNSRGLVALTRVASSLDTYSTNLVRYQYQDYGGSVTGGVTGLYYGRMARDDNVDVGVDLEVAGARATSTQRSGESASHEAPNKSSRWEVVAGLIALIALGGMVVGAGYGLWALWAYRDVLFGGLLNGALWVGNVVLQLSKGLFEAVWEVVKWIANGAGSVVGKVWEMLKAV